MCVRAAHLAGKKCVICEDDEVLCRVSVRLVTKLKHSSKWDPIWGEMLMSSEPVQPLLK